MDVGKKRRKGESFVSVMVKIYCPVRIHCRPFVNAANFEPILGNRDEQNFSLCPTSICASYSGFSNPKKLMRPRDETESFHCMGYSKLPFGAILAKFNTNAVYLNLVSASHVL